LIKRLLSAVVLVAFPSLGYADEASDFALFWGTVLAIEDQCPQYLSRTDAISGAHLSGQDYQWAASQVDRLRSSAAKTVEHLGCDKSAEEAAKLMGYSFFYLWEVQ
jgi:hypothetical protein